MYGVQIDKTAISSHRKEEMQARNKQAAQFRNRVKQKAMEEANDKTQSSERDLEKDLGDDAAGCEYVHRLGHLPIASTAAFRRLRANA